MAIIQTAQVYVFMLLLWALNCASLRVYASVVVLLFTVVLILVHMSL